MYRVEDLPISIPIGRQGENHAMKIEIDCSSFLAEWPQATITAMLKRSVAENPYILITSIDSKGVLTWEPTAHDTGIEGDGQIEIRAVENDVLAKSVTAIVCVERSLTPPEPDTPIDWVEDIKSDIAQSVTSAASSATDAAKSAASAQESAAEAAGSANAAQSSANAAAGSASAAGTSATSAEKSADAASGSASEAAKSASDADASAKASAASAAEAAGTLDSVKASADAAAASARAAAESASDAAGSKSNAAQSATDAAQSASAAAGSASQSAAARDAAQAAQTAAGAAASDAAGSASVASGSKDAAAQSATEAAASAAKAEKAAQDAMEIIDDDVIAEDSTWSSKQITDQNYTHFTVSGNPAVCEDVLEGYPLELSASWEPKQEGSGTPSPDNVRAIVGLKTIKVQRSGKNLLNVQPFATTNKNGIMFEYVEPGGIKISGTATRMTDGPIIRDMILPPGTYNGWTAREVNANINATRNGASLYLNANTTFTIEAGDKINWWYISVSAGKTVDTTIYPYIVSGSKPSNDVTAYNGDTYTLNMQNKIYCGNINVKDGKGEETYMLVDVTAAASAQEMTTVMRANVSLPQTAAAAKTGNAISSWLVEKVDHYIDEESFYTNGNTAYIKIAKSRLTSYDLAGVNSYLSAHPLQILYKLLTPKPFAIANAQTIPALAGANVIITDADTLTVGGVKPLRKPIDDTRVETDNVWSAKHTDDEIQAAVSPVSAALGGFAFARGADGSLSISYTDAEGIATVTLPTETTGAQVVSELTAINAKLYKIAGTEGETNGST